MFTSSSQIGLHPQRLSIYKDRWLQNVDSLLAFTSLTDSSKALYMAVAPILIIRKEEHFTPHETMTHACIRM